MTSVILAQKLMSLNLSKSELDKIKDLRRINREAILGVVPSVKEIIDSQIKNKTCRICLKPGRNRIFEIKEFDCVIAMKNILQIEVMQNDSKPQHICVSCEITLKNADELKRVADITQWRLQQELDMVTDAQSARTEDISRGGYVMEKINLSRRWDGSPCENTFDIQEESKSHESLPECNSFVCEICGMKFIDLAKLNKHRSIHTKKSGNSCTRCPFVGHTRWALVTHERNHDCMKPLFTCPYCAATFTCPRSLEKHCRRHTQKSYKCQMCPIFFRYKQNLDKHYETVHRPGETYKCHICGVDFSTRETMLIHKLTHNRVDDSE